MMKLKLAHNIINLLSNIYSDGKSEYVLQCSIMIREKSEGEMLHFREAAKQSETIHLEYKRSKMKIGCIWIRPNNSI